jgi:hypothetical protein
MDAKNRPERVPYASKRYSSYRAFIFQGLERIKISYMREVFACAEIRTGASSYYCVRRFTSCVTCITQTGCTLASYYGGFFG